MLEIILETRTCAHCDQEFDITDVDQDFLTRLAPTIWGEKFDLPFPTLCPKCRKLRRHAWRNEKNIYKRNCDATGKEIISLFSPDAPCPVYESDYWYSDKWDALQYGRDFDFSRPFFEQWGELKSLVPMPGKAISQTMENSLYSDNCSNMKDCYLCFNAGTLEKSLYTICGWESSHSIDCLNVVKCENCYELIVWFQCYDVHYSYDVKNSRESAFLYSCDGCQNCYGCHDLENKQYYIFNQAYSQEEYRAKLLVIKNSPIESQKATVLSFLRDEKYLISPLRNIWCENISDSSESINSKSISHSKMIRTSTDMRYCVNFSDTRVAMDSDIWWDRSDLLYESHQIGENIHQILFSICIFANISDLIYCLYCVNNVHNCFWCIGLRNASYCIFNKQYTKQEYEKLVPKIIAHMRKTWEWWEFIPARYSHFGYNQTMNMIVNPLSKEEAEKQGFYWSDYEAPFPKVEKIIPADKLPDTIEWIPDDVLNWAIECEMTKKPFRIMKSELEFYRKYNLPIPRRHPDERYKERTKIYMNY